MLLTTPAARCELQRVARGLGGALRPRVVAAVCLVTVKCVVKGRRERWISCCCWCWCMSRSSGSISPTKLLLAFSGPCAYPFSGKFQSASAPSACPPVPPLPPYISLPSISTFVTHLAALPLSGVHSSLRQNWRSLKRRKRTTKTAAATQGLPSAREQGAARPRVTGYVEFLQPKRLLCNSVSAFVFSSCSFSSSLYFVPQLARRNAGEREARVQRSCMSLFALCPLDIGET